MSDGESDLRAPAPAPGRLAFSLAQVGGLAAQRFAQRLAPLGLTPPQAGLLRAVAAEPGRSQQTLAAELELLPSRLVALLDELETDGLVERRRNLRDRRQYALHLTPAGVERLSQIGRVAQEHGRDLLAPLDAEERKTLGQLLDRLSAYHQLASGVHPGYRTLGTRPASGSLDDQGAPAGR